MRLKWIAVLAVGLLAAQVSAEDPPVLKTEKDRVSYAIGVEGARSFQRLGIDIDVDILAKAIRDVYAGEKLLMTEGDLLATMTAHQAEVRQKLAEAARRLAESNKKAGDAFLAANKAKEGIVTLPSGLQYRILRAGSGKKPTDADTVEVQYRATFIDGTEFDSSYRTRMPATFKLAGVIPGWKEALQLMPVGSKWQLFMPPQLAYGERGTSRDIGPNATLLFEVELLGIK
jgi:FKBP-type peptidyl-prolyl cis-trans isomerase FklB